MLSGHRLHEKIYPSVSTYTLHGVRKELFTEHGLRGAFGPRAATAVVAHVGST